MKSVVLWNPVDLGYAAVYVTRAVVDGKLKAGATEVEAGKLGKLQIVNGSEVLLGPPFIYSEGQHRRLRLLSADGRGDRSRRSPLQRRRAAAQATEAAVWPNRMRLDSSVSTVACVLTSFARS